MTEKELIKRIEARQTHVGIAGMGYVGLPLMRTFCEAGFTCVGLDVDPAKVEMLNAGQSYIKHITPEFLKESIKRGAFRATAEPRIHPDHREARAPTRAAS